MRFAVFALLSITALLHACGGDDAFNPINPVTPPGTSAQRVDVDYVITPATAGDFTGVSKASNISAIGAITDIRHFQAAADHSVITYAQRVLPTDAVTDLQFFKAGVGADAAISTFPMDEKLSPANAAAMSADGSTLTWVSGKDHKIGTNADRSVEAFSISTDGSGLRLLTNCATGLKNFFPTISADGSLVAFICADDLTGDNPGQVDQVFVVSTVGAGTVTQLTGFTAATGITALAISGDESRIVFSAPATVGGVSTSTSNEVFILETGLNSSEPPALSLVTNFADTGSASGFVLSESGDMAIYRRDDALYATDTLTQVTVRLSSDGWQPPLPLSATTANAWSLSADGNIAVYIDIDTVNEHVILRETATRPVDVVGTPTLVGKDILTVQPVDIDSVTQRFIAPIVSSDGSQTAFLSSIPLGIDLTGFNAQQIYTVPH